MKLTKFERYNSYYISKALFASSPIYYTLLGLRTLIDNICISMYMFLDLSIGHNKLLKKQSSSFSYSFFFYIDYRYLLRVKS